MDASHDLTPQKPDTYRDKKPGGKPLQVLMVEDISSDAILTRRAMNKTGISYQVHTLSKGAQVMPYLANYHFTKYQSEARIELPDLIMLDLGMPGVNGFDILESLAAAHGMIRAIPIVILSSYTHFDYLCKTHKLWIPAYLNKPCDPQKLRAIMLSAMQGRISFLHQ